MTGLQPQELVKKITKSQMVKSSIILSIGMMAANVSNYVFHLLMGRFLGPVDYGNLAVLIALLYLIMVPTLTIQTALAKYSADFYAQESYSKIHFLLRYVNQRLFVAGVIIFFIFVLVSRWISGFLNIPSVLPVIFLSFSFLTIYTISVNRGVLQGIQDFSQLSANLLLEAIVKLAAGVLLVYLGFSVNGAIIGIVLGVSLAYGASFIPLRSFIIQHDKEAVQLGKIARYSLPVFISLLCLTAYYNVDIIIVKHFFHEYQAGIYAGLAILGKVVLFASLAISQVMFPIVASLHTRDQEHKQYLYYTFALVSVVSGAFVGLYFVAPRFTIKTLFGAKYLLVAPYLGVFGIAMLLLSLSYVLINYYLACRKTTFVYFLAFMVPVQAIALWFFHNSIAQVVTIMTVFMSVLFLGLFAFNFTGGSSGVDANGD